MMQHESSYLLDIVAYFAQLHGLTAREQEIVYCLSKYGYSNKRLAGELCISEKTVKNHIAKIQEKTSASSTRELLSMVVEQFIVCHSMQTDKKLALAL
ncbi:response regulator transcription factor [Cohnella terricola]|uniref:Helix-turn-helix transcriptional regulator n=1 Tax=Cohnella terricola TaxID=1289167 RepID=A0A559JIP4_9BACL|nr:helix-turn-helix transcriptional regulator [Cohnella terricola]TVX99738.1 helix-turn-helix transcriptional regulator [Cohnella terricola]